MNNKSNISSKLKNKSLIVSQGYINGSFTSGTSNKTFNVNDPSTGELIIELPDMGVSETKEAINAVRFISSLRIFACLEEVNEARKSTCI